MLKFSEGYESSEIDDTIPRNKGKIFLKLLKLLVLDFKTQNLTAWGFRLTSLFEQNWLIVVILSKISRINALICHRE